MLRWVSRENSPIVSPVAMVPIVDSQSLTLPPREARMWSQEREGGPAMSKTPQIIDPAGLPEVITSYLKAHQARDLDVAMQGYEPDATVTDEGRTYNGPEQIRAWLSRSA